MDNTLNGKQQKFVDIATRRTNKVLDSLRLLGQCSNKRTYDYDSAQVNKIFSEIDRQLRETKQKFQGSKKSRFQL